LPAAGIIYAETNVLIYEVEGIQPFTSVAKPLWDSLDAQTCQVATSELTYLEVLTKPLRDGNQALVSRYRAVLSATSGLHCHPIDLATLELAAEIRAAYALKSPDAIHAATALLAQCALFVTNDAVFRRVPGLRVAVLKDFLGPP
jgi:predicted nucleic acid-binding protein